MKKIILVGILSSFLYSSYSQKVVKMYFNGNHLLSLDHQVDPKTGVENGYYKQYEYSGRLAEEGFYKMGRKNGVWKKYNQYGQIIAYDTYKNDTLNGLKKQFCDNDANGGIYQCYESIYKNGEEMFSTKFYPNGTKMFFYDKEKGTEIKYSIKGEADTKVINGKTYRYNIDDDGNNVGVNEIFYDSLGLRYRYYYDASYGLGTVGNELRHRLSRYEIDIPKKILGDDGKQYTVFNTVASWTYTGYDLYNISHLTFTSDSLKMDDSTIFRKGCLLYKYAPNPNNQNLKVDYDSLKDVLIDGDKVFKYLGKQNTFCKIEFLTYMCYHDVHEKYRFNNDSLKYDTAMETMTLQDANYGKKYSIKYDSNDDKRLKIEISNIQNANYGKQHRSPMDFNSKDEIKSKNEISNTVNKNTVEYFEIPQIAFLAEKTVDKNGKVNSLIYHYLKGFGGFANEYFQTEIKDPRQYF